MQSQRQSFSGALLSLALGALYILLTLPRGTMRLAAELGWPWLADAGEWGAGVNLSLTRIFPSYPELITYLMYALVLYLGALLLLALRHGRFGYLGWGLFTLILATFIFHLLAWVGFISVKLINFLAWLIGVVVSFLANIVAIVIIWLLNRLADLIVLVYYLLVRWFGGLWWIGAIVGLVAIIFILYKIRQGLWEAIKLAVQTVIGLVVGVGVVYVLIQLWRIISPFVLPILAWLWKAILFLVHWLILLATALAALVVIATIGQLLLDQIRGAWTAGNRTRGVIIGAMAIGTSLALLLLVSNVYNTNALLPADLASLAGIYLHQSAPVLDTLISLLVGVLSIIGVLRNLFVLGIEPTMEEFGKSLVYSAAGVVIGGAIAAVGTQSES